MVDNPFSLLSRQLSHFPPPLDDPLSACSARLMTHPRQPPNFDVAAARTFRIGSSSNLSAKEYALLHDATDPYLWHLWRAKPTYAFLLLLRDEVTRRRDAVVDSMPSTAKVEPLYGLPDAFWLQFFPSNRARRTRALKAAYGPSSPNEPPGFYTFETPWPATPTTSSPIHRELVCSDHPDPSTIPDPVKEEVTARGRRLLRCARNQTEYDALTITFTTDADGTWMVWS